MKLELFSVNPLKQEIMLRTALGLAILALIAGVLGFGGMAAGFATIAKIVFYIAIALLAISLITGGFRRG